jgi:exosortase E/protease (VPEID-CTERM system)
LPALVALLAIEVVSLTVRFDALGRFRALGGVARVFDHARLLGRVGISMAVAVLVFGGGRAVVEVGREAAGRRAGAWVVAHLAAFAGFAAASVRVLDPSARATWAGMAGWAALGALTLASWCAAAISPRLWPALAWRSRRALAIGLGISLLVAAGGELAQRALWDWGPLARATLWAVHGLLVPVLDDLEYDPSRTLIGTRDFSVTIVSACSGYEGIGLIWVVLAAYLTLCRRAVRWPNALLLFPIGAAIMWGVNVLRIVALILIGAWGWPDLAVGGFHSQAGWMALNAVGLGMVAFARRSSFFEKAAAEPGPATSNPAAPYLVPELAIVATTMFTALFAAGFDALYPARIGAAALAFWAYRRSWAWPRSIAVGSAVGVGVVVFAVWMALEPIGPGSAGGTALRSWLASLPRGAAWAWLAVRVVGSVVVVPIAEELAFRGYLTRRLIAADFERVPPGQFSWPAFLGSSLAFGLLHGRWLAGTLAGLAYALAYYRRRSLADAVIAHATTNALIAAVVLATGDFAPWA